MKRTVGPGTSVPSGRVISPDKPVLHVVAQLLVGGQLGHLGSPGSAVRVPLRD